MLRKAGRIGAALAALAAIAVGSAAAAGAASQDNPPGDGGGRRAHKPETPLSGTTAKVKAAALAKVDGGTIIRVETDGDHGSPYEAHVRKPDGTEAEVLVNKQFEVTAMNSFGPRG